MKKIVWLFSSFTFQTNEQKVNFEREVRNDILCQNKDNICLEICHTSDTGLIYFGVKQLIKKKAPHVVVFHECPENVVDSHTNHISRALKEKPLFLHKPKPGEQRNGESHQINNLKEVALFLTAV